MNGAWIGLAVWLSVSEPQAGLELQYAGTVTQQTKNGETDVKTFSVQSVITAAQDGSLQVAYHVDERVFKSKSLQTLVPSKRW